MAERTGATFPIGYGLKVPEDADKVGAYWEERRGDHSRDWLHDRAGSKNSPGLLCHRPHRPHRSRGCVKLDTGNQAEESRKAVLNWSNSKAGTDDFADNSQSLLDIIPINIQMSHHAHSAGVHRTTEHMALGQPF